MKEIGKERKIALAALIVAVLMLTVAFAAMSRTLKINGTAKVDSAAWDIRFTSAEMKSKKGDARQVAEPVIDNGGIKLTLKVGLRKPKDEITYEAVIENLGDIDAEIESIEYPTLSEDQAKIIEFVATYQNGDEISKSQELKAKDEKTVKIIVRYKDITDESLLAKEAYDIPLTFKINYIQKGFNTESTPEGGEIVDDGTKAVLASLSLEELFGMEDPSVASFANSPMGRAEIETLTFSKGKSSARNGNSWDASAAGDGSITGYYTDSDSNGLYEVVIESASNIYAPVDSFGLFVMFVSVKEINFNNFKTDDATNMSYMFAMNPSLTSLNLSSFNTTNVTNMSYMFAGDGDEDMTLKSIDLSGWDTSNVTDMSYMFNGCSSLTSVDVSNWNTSNVTDMSWMFSDCSSLTNLDVSNFDTTNVTDMSYMFNGCSSLTNLDVSNFDTTNVTDMEDMFRLCSSLTSLDLSNFNTQNVTNMEAMFDGCSSLENLDLSSFDTINVTRVHGMFADCSSLTELKLNSADFSSISSMGEMFDGVSDITIYVKDQAAIDFLNTTYVENAQYKIEPLN